MVRFPPKTVYKIVSEFILHKKQAFLDYRNIGNEVEKLDFFKGVNPWFWPKVDLFCPFRIVCENIFKRGN